LCIVFIGNEMADTSNYQSFANITAVPQGLVPSAGNGISPGGVPSTTQYSMAAAGVVMNSVSNISSPISDAALSGSATFNPSTNPLDTGDNSNSNPAQKTATTQQATSGAYAISYPGDLPKYYMTLGVYDYVRQKPLESTLVTPKYTIALPLPDGEGLTDNTSTQWNDSSLGHWGNALENSNAIQSVLRNFLGNKNASAPDNDSAKTMISDLGGDALLYIADSFAKNASAEMAGTIESATGLAPNPALAMTFKQVDFRKFQFSWLLSARNNAETDIIKNIVVALKQAQLPNFTKGSSLIFQYPNIVQPAFFPKNAQNYMTDFKPCVITAVNVRYSPASKSPSFYSTTGAPVFVELSIALEEMQIRLPGDYQLVNQSNTSPVTAKASQGAQTGLEILGISARGITPPTSGNKNTKPTDPGASDAQQPGMTSAHQAAEAARAKGQSGYEPVHGG